MDQGIAREYAYSILTEYVKEENLIRHCLAVEVAMRAYAAKFNEDVEKWGIVGLLHDFDYEIYPSLKDHPVKGSEILREKGLPEDIIYSILTHADYLNLPRICLMDKTLFAVDELVGFIIAVSLVMPGKSIQEVTVKSVMRKLKDKSFARSVDREIIRKGCIELAVDFDDHILFLINKLGHSE